MKTVPLMGIPVGSRKRAVALIHHSCGGSVIHSAEVNRSGISKTIRCVGLSRKGCVDHASRNRRHGNHRVRTNSSSESASISRRTRRGFAGGFTRNSTFTERRSEIADSRARRKVPCTRSFAVLAANLHQSWPALDDRDSRDDHGDRYHHQHFDHRKTARLVPTSARIQSVFSARSRSHPRVARG